LTAPFDFLDGMVARLRKEPSDFGAFVDSVTDRYSELVLFGGLLIYYLLQSNWVACIGIYLAAIGSQMVSYARSRAESLGFEAKIGILTRFERYLVMVPSLIFNYPMVGVWILAIFTNITAMQRIFYVRQQYYNRLLKK
jgi:CDP-diacylglycerol---glycerol-3-phosphate 3-phosphatidyltransferase